jgi:hypothetical protein
MKSAALLLLALVACQRGETDSGAPAKTVVAAAVPGSDYAKDIAALCDSVTRSGADKVDEDARTLTIANWLGANLKSAESRQFLVQIQPLVGEPKATALDNEAKRVGLSGCALAAEWRTPHTN